MFPLLCFALTALTEMIIYPTSVVTIEDTAHDGTFFVIPFLEDTEEDTVQAPLFPELPYSKKEAPEKLIAQNCMTLQRALEEKIYGQEEAIRATADAVLRFAAGVHDPNMPIATMLYYGPSGVGKTELANQLCAHLYGDDRHIIRLNMSEFSERHTLSRLIGAPPGYLGYGDGGQLSNAILKNPCSVVLLDESEKAHPEVLKLFLHIFDTGYFCTSEGKSVDCRKCIFIMTSNLGALEIIKLYQKGLDTEEIIDRIRPLFFTTFSPELFNRTEPVLFAPLSQELAEKLVLKLLKNLSDRVYLNKQIQLTYDQSLITFLACNGIDPMLGARPLKRMVEKTLTTAIAQVILAGKCTKNDRLHCYYADGSVLIEKR